MSFYVVRIRFVARASGDAGHAGDYTPRKSSLSAAVKRARRGALRGASFLTRPRKDSTPVYARRSRALSEDARALRSATTVFVTGVAQGDDVAVRWRLLRCWRLLRRWPRGVRGEASRRRAAENQRV